MFLVSEHTALLPYHNITAALVDKQNQLTCMTAKCEVVYVILTHDLVKKLCKNYK